MENDMQLSRRTLPSTHLNLDSYKTPRSGIHESSWQFGFATRAWLKVDGSFMVFVSAWHVVTTVSQLISVFVSNHESYKNIRQPKGLSSSSKGRQEYVWDHHLVHLGSNWLEAFAPLKKNLPWLLQQPSSPAMGCSRGTSALGTPRHGGFNVDMQLFGSLDVMNLQW